MVSSPVDPAQWAYSVPANDAVNNPANIKLYGDSNLANHKTRPGNWKIGRSVKFPTGETLQLEKVVYGVLDVGLWYRNNLGSDYYLNFPHGREIDDITAYALDAAQNILYILLDGDIYSVNLNDANANGEGEFVKW